MIRYETFTTFDNTEVEFYLSWLAEKTELEYDMRPRDLKFFKENAISATFVFDDDTIIAGAMIIICLNRNGEKMYLEHKLVVELGSNYVDPHYRSKKRPELKIAKQLVLQRLIYTLENDYFPVVVTGSEAIRSILTKVGALEMKEYPHYKDIYGEVRVCDCHKKPCGSCPLKEKAIWFLIKPDLMLINLKTILSRLAA